MHINELVLLDSRKYFYPNLRAYIFESKEFGILPEADVSCESGTGNTSNEKCPPDYPIMSGTQLAVFVSTTQLNALVGWRHLHTSDSNDML